MRILFTSAGGRGHSDPLLPIARASRRAGHAVAFCCRPPMAATIEADGFATFLAGPAIAAPPTIAPLAPVDLERELRVVRDGFAGRGIAAQRAPELRNLCTTWRPDVLVCDETDFGALVAAEAAGLPYATVLVSPTGAFLRPDVLASPVAQLRAANGLSPDPQLEMLTRYLVFAPGPPSLRDPAYPLAGTAHPIRPSALDDDAVPFERDTGTGRPLVYFTLGSIFNLESGDLFERVLGGLRDIPADIVMTVGDAVEPDSFGPQPENVRIARFVPHSAVLPVCSVVVSHGGSGTVLGALAHGAPMVLLPMGADQPVNAARCGTLGVARVLDPLSCTPDDVRDAAASVLGDPEYRRRAGALRDETRGLPDAAACVALLEQLAVARRPITLVG